jgi:hypothetical protein
MPTHFNRFRNLGHRDGEALHENQPKYHAYVDAQVRDKVDRKEYARRDDQ